MWLQCSCCHGGNATSRVANIARSIVALGLRPIKFRSVTKRNPITSEGQHSEILRHSRYSVIAAAAGAGSTKAAAKDEGGEEELKQAHKLFDQVVIFVKAGDGGNGAVLHPPRPWKAGETPGLKGGKLNAREAEELRRKLRRKEAEKAKAMKKVGTFKRDADGLAIVPMGGHGGDVVIHADPSLSTLLPLHRKKRHVARSGGHVDAKGGLARRVPDGLQGPVLRIAVPVGTVVKRKRGGKFLADLANPGDEVVVATGGRGGLLSSLLADLTNPGDEVVVARGGRGGISVYEVPASNKAHLRPVKAPLGTTVMTAPEDKQLTYGLQGEEVALELTLRVVADVGLVGFPNAGKSSLLAAVTAARPEIADYPFTTLMPNLGRMPADPAGPDGGFGDGPTLADLPGLIEGAHVGKGLGRMFLRHLRRTRVLLHVLDASAPDPIHDYVVLREELRMYNPEYTSRPHILVLNKIDLPEVRARIPDLTSQIAQLTSASQQADASITSKNTSYPSSPSSSPPRAYTEEGSLSRLDDDWEDSRGSAVADAESDVNVTMNGGADVEASPSERLEPPIAIVHISAREGEGIEDLLTVVREAVEAERRGELRGGEGRKGVVGRAGGRGGMARRSSRGVQGGVEREKAPQWQL
ncbi:unnamed protein product [Closterium sp. Yama58-4]|nr:unnamed protein product [Closterium sp. Yama58-4]